MSKYTPGPWEAGAGKLWRHDILGVFTKPNKIIAACGEQRGDDEEESIANAYLIAAAPELFESGKEMAEAVALLPAEDGRILGLLPILCRLRAAIAKTEARPVETKGEEP